MIGIVGGVGPLAGLDMAAKLIEETKAKSDQEHLSFILSSQPSRIVDRTEFLLGRVTVNPAFALAEIIVELGRAGATVAAIPCNTAHSPRIFDVVREELKRASCRVKLLHMIDETAGCIQPMYGRIKVGIISTTGTRSEGLYRKALVQHGLVPVEPAEELQEQIHAAVYDEDYGIKANPAPVSARARLIISSAIETLVILGAKAVILGCTELPIAMPQKKMYGVPLIDPNRIIARALIREVDESRLII